MTTNTSTWKTIELTTWRRLVDAAAAWGFSDLASFAGWVADQADARSECLPEPPTPAERAQMDEIDQTPAGGQPEEGIQ